MRNMEVDQSEFLNRRTYRTNRRSSVNRACGVSVDVTAQDNRTRPDEVSQARVPAQQQGEAVVQQNSFEQRRNQAWESDSEDGEDEECVLATPPDKRARY